MRLQPDVSDLEIDQPMRFALYETHRFCIRLPAEASLLEEDGAHRRELDPMTLSIFLHEYTHFSHNVTTLAGWATFELFIQLIAIFSHALDDTGACHPETLEDRDRQSAISCAKALLMLEGERSLPQSFNTAASVRLAGVTKRTEENVGIGCDVRTAQWEATSAGGSVTSATTDIGAFIINEGIAYLFESFVTTGRIAFHQSSPFDPLPFFPYVAYQTLCRTLAPEISPVAAIQVGLLALNYNRPGEALVRTLEAYQRMRESGQTDTAACEALRKTIVPSLQATLNRVLVENLRHLPPLFEKRGRLEDGVRQIHKWFSDGLGQRHANIWFDLDWLANGVIHADLLTKRLREQTSCDVIQERDGVHTKLGRDALITFSGIQDGNWLDALSGVRTFQAQMDYLLRHLRKSGEFVATEHSAKQSCPYFTTCQLKMREADPETCSERPWTLWTKDPTCWYGAAVAGTLGHVRHESDGTT